MGDQSKLQAELAAGPHAERRCQLLSTFLSAFDAGGPDEATAALAQELAYLERDFQRKLAELQQHL